MAGPLGSGGNERGRKDSPFHGGERERGRELRGLPAPDGGSPVVRLGEGNAVDLSPDGKWALANVPTTPPQLLLYPTGAGEPRRLEDGGLVSRENAQFFPDGKKVLVCGHEEGKAVRCFVQDVAGGKPRPVTPEGTTQGLVAPDGRLVLVKASGGALLLYPAEGGEARPVPGATAEDLAIRWNTDGRPFSWCARERFPRVSSG